MKKTVNLFYLVFSIAAFAIFAILTLSFSIHYEWLSYGSFWTVWLMAVVPIIASTVVTCCYLNKFQNSETFVSLPLIICSSSFAAVTYVLGAVLTIAIPASNGKVNWFMWVIEMIAIVIYAVILFYLVYGTNYIATNRRNVKTRVNYIRRMYGELNVIIPTIEDTELKNAVEELRDNIRYSDPMSNDSVMKIEVSLYAIVSDIVEKINAGTDFDMCKISLQKAKLLLAQRNEEIKFSK